MYRYATPVCRQTGKRYKRILLYIYSMIEPFFDYIEQRMPLTIEEKSYLEQVLPIAEYKKGEYLLREGEVSDRFFFNLKGFVRLYYNVDGEEVSTFFYPEGIFISAYESYLLNKPADQNFQAVEDTHVVVIKKDMAEELLISNPKMVRMAVSAMEDELMNCQRIIASLLTQEPEQRYIKFLSEYGDYFSRVPQRHIASYIGVKPESLSRIKRRVQQLQNHNSG